jgi:hypothetical protein
MNCQTCQFEIEDLRANEPLSEEARAHLSVCPVCRAFHDERQALRKLVGSLESVSAPADFDFRLRARLAAAKEAGNHRFSWRSFLASAPAIGVAATFALLVAAVVFYNQMKKSPVTERPGLTAAVPSPERKPEQESVNASQTANAPETPDEIRKDDGAAATVAVVGQRPRGNSNGGKQSIRREATQTGAVDSQIISNDIAVRSAPQIVRDGAAPFNAGTNAVELPVRSASQPMRVFVDDRSGAKRAVTLEPVIFGSQDFTGGSATPRMASSQGIW